MSSTATATTTTTRSDDRVVATIQQDYLADYSIRLTGAEDLTPESDIAAAASSSSSSSSRPQHLAVVASSPSPSPSSSPAQQSRAAAAENPPGWPDDLYRRVPPYRPANRNLDMSERPVGSNTGEAVFIAHLFAGVWITSTANWIWRKTLGGRLNDGIFRYPVGGET